MNHRFINAGMGALAGAGLMLAGWGIVIAPDEAGRDRSAWGWFWTLQHQAE